MIGMSACDTPQVQLSESTVRELVRLLATAKVIPDTDEQGDSTTVITIEHRRAGEGPVQKQPSVETPYLTLDEAAAYCRCSPKTILNHHSLGNVHALPAARPLRFRREDLDKWLMTRRRSRRK